ncbi:unnamed protein product [Amoebophrya sp. A120]|nr:unnamed protein product [Amoebophrya sp. A120]CAD7928207.1 unnamed protein product [Amoebophrya sp. A120]|eukprot:GSA120T00018616001.1
MQSFGTGGANHQQAFMQMPTGPTLQCGQQQSNFCAVSASVAAGPGIVPVAQRNAQQDYSNLLRQGPSVPPSLQRQWGQQNHAVQGIPGGPAGYNSLTQIPGNQQGPENAPQLPPTNNLIHPSMCRQMPNNQQPGFHFFGGFGAVPTPTEKTGATIFVGGRPLQDPMLRQRVEALLNQGAAKHASGASCNAVFGQGCSSARSTTSDGSEKSCVSTNGSLRAYEDAQAAADAEAYPY